MATLDDVARLSQVSAMTVSRVINNKGSVSEATQQRVMDAINQLNYRPNLVARGLATCRTNSIGVVVSRLENPNYAVMVAGINRKAAEYGYDILLGNGEGTAGVIQSINTLLNKQVDGLIILPEETRESLLAVLAHDPRPTYQNDPERVYGMAFAGHNVRFTVADGVLTVLEFC